MILGKGGETAIAIPVEAIFLQILGLLLSRSQIATNVTKTFYHGLLRPATFQNLVAGMITPNQMSNNGDCIHNHKKIYVKIDEPPMIPMATTVNNTRGYIANVGSSSTTIHLDRAQANVMQSSLTGSEVICHTFSNHRCSIESSAFH